MTVPALALDGPGWIFFPWATGAWKLPMLWNPLQSNVSMGAKLVEGQAGLLGKVKAAFFLGLS